jgi:hypothetical protein
MTMDHSGPRTSETERLLLRRFCIKRAPSSYKKLPHPPPAYSCPDCTRYACDEGGGKRVRSGTRPGNRPERTSPPRPSFHCAACGRKYGEGEKENV